MLFNYLVTSSDTSKLTGSTSLLALPTPSMASATCDAIASTINIRTGGIFWFAFLFYKYYDLFWDLLHKSIFLSALGLILIAISYLIRQNARPKLLTLTEVDLEN